MQMSIDQPRDNEFIGTLDYIVGIWHIDFVSNLFDQSIPNEDVAYKRLCTPLPIHTYDGCSTDQGRHDVLLNTRYVWFSRPQTAGRTGRRLFRCWLRPPAAAEREAGVDGPAGHGSTAALFML